MFRVSYCKSTISHKINFFKIPFTRWSLSGHSSAVAASLFMIFRCVESAWTSPFQRTTIHLILDNYDGLYRGGTKKKGQMLNCSSSFNFWDMKTLILSKDRIFDIVFGGINFKMRQLLVYPHMAQNQKWQKNFLLIFVPPSFFWASLICSAYNIDL